MFPNKNINCGDHDFPIFCVFTVALSFFSLFTTGSLPYAVITATLSKMMCDHGFPVITVSLFFFCFTAILPFTMTVALPFLLMRPRLSFSILCVVGKIVTAAIFFCGDQGFFFVCDDLR